MQIPDPIVRTFQLTLLRSHVNLELHSQKEKQHWKFTHNFILWSLNVTTVAMEKQQCVSLFIVIGTDVAVNIKAFSVVTEMQQRIPYVPLSIYKIFSTSFNPYPANVENMVSS